MGFKFRKRIKILPGIKLNLSKSGISTTIGTKGLSVNVEKKGTYLNTGIPGTGLYDRKRIDINNSTTENNDVYNTETLEADNTIDYNLQTETKNIKNKTIATFLALFLGAIGIHKFYLRETKKGILFLVFSVTLIPFLLSLIDFVKLIYMNEETFNDKYNHSQGA